MEYISSALMTLGVIFILLSLINYLRFVKNFEKVHKIMQFPYRNKKVLIVFIGIIFLLFLYLAHFSRVILNGAIDNKFTFVSSLLFFMDGFFIYVIIMKTVVTFLFSMLLRNIVQYLMKI